MVGWPAGWLAAGWLAGCGKAGRGRADSRVTAGKAGRGRANSRVTGNESITAQEAGADGAWFLTAGPGYNTKTPSVEVRLLRVPLLVL